MSWLDRIIVALIVVGCAQLAFRLRRKPLVRRAAAVALVGLVATGGAYLLVEPGNEPSARPLSGTPRPTSEAAAVGVVVLAAGDIASCASEGDEATARLLNDRPGLVLALGDTVYERGTAAEYAECYDPTWGRHKDRTRPIPGNHEYGVAGASGYFDYFGSAAGERGRGYYAFDYGAWRIVALNSVCSQLWGQTLEGRWVDGCARGSAQERWLRDELASHPRRCVLAMVHDPRFSSGSGVNHEVRAFWEDFAVAGVDLVLSGDAHHYERFALQDVDGNRDDERGIRQFVVGTGGRSTQKFGELLANSEHQAAGHGVLELTLYDGWYEWKFIPAVGRRSGDSGRGECDGAAVLE